MKRFSAIIVVFFLANACFDQNECLITSTNLVKIELATKAGVSQNIRFISVRQDSLNGGTAHQEFSFYEGYPLSILALPLDDLHDTSFFSFETSDSIKYKIAFRYSKSSRVISDDCGAFLYYKDLAVIKSEAYSFDSTAVVEPQLFLSVTTNVKVLF